MSAQPIYLASKSPRRQELLRQLGVSFDVLLMREAAGRPADVVEIANDGEPAKHYVERIARTKAGVGWMRVQKRGIASRPVLGADSEVVLDDGIFGKPVDAKHAAEMLARLSGRTHRVLTGVAVNWEDNVAFALSETAVTFRDIGAREIARYVATGEPLDKAGGYAIQGLGAAFVARIEGSYSGVMGLPLFETAAALARVGVSVL